MSSKAGVPGPDRRGGHGGVDSPGRLDGRDEIRSGLVGDLLYPQQMMGPEGCLLILMEVEGSIEAANHLAFEVAQALPVPGGSERVKGEMVLTPGQHFPCP